MILRIIDSRLTLLIFLISLPFFASAQNNLLSFDKLTLEQGLSNNNTTSIIQDKNGFIWIGTWEGLNRYDGSNVKVYKHVSHDTTSLVNNEVACQYLDVHGNLWIGTNKGISLYNPAIDGFTNHSLIATKRGISDARVKGFFEDSEKNLYAGVESGWIYKFNNQSKQLELFDTTRFSEVTTSKITLNNKLFIGTLNGLMISDLNAGTATMLLQKKTTDIVLVDGDEVWIGVRAGGLYRYNLKSQKLIQLESVSSRYNNVQGIYKDAKGNIWVTGGVLRYYDKQGKIHEQMDEEKDLSKSESTVFLEDRDGNLWIGMYYAGLRIVRKNKKFHSYRSIEGLKPQLLNKVVSAIAMDAKQRLWVGYYEGGIDVIDIATGEKQFITPGRGATDLSPGSVLLIYEDSQHQMWVGTYRGGLHHFDNLKLVRKFNNNPQDSTSIAENDIRSMVEYKPGEFWIITHGKGLDIHKKLSGSFSHFKPTNNQEFDQWGFQLVKDQQGDLWYATSTGLYSISCTNGAMRLYNNVTRDSTSISENTINCVYVDSKARLWAGTANGLNLFIRNKNSFVRFTEAEGLPNAVINAINEDDRGILWVSTNKGLFSLDMDGLNPAKVKIRSYDFSDGLADEQFYPRATFKDKKTGVLYFGGINGITWFHPDSIQTTQAALKVVFTDFSLFHQTVVPGKKDSPLKQHISIADLVDLKYDQRIITFEFVAPYFLGTKKVHYAYTLTGFDKKWNYTGTEQKATYTNLDPGEYTFKVKASSNGVDWGKEVTSVRIVIHPPWWNTPLAKVVYVLLLVATLYVYRRISLRQAQLLHNLRVEKINRENIEKLNQAKLQFFTNVSHEFRTPLTLILGPLHHLLDSRKGGKIFRDQLLMINSNAQRLLRLVNQLLDFRKAESGNMNLEVTEGNLVKFVKEIKLSFEPLADEMNIDFVFQADNSAITLWFDRYQAEKIFFNLLSNAFKNTPEGGKILVRIEEHDHEVVVEVRDTGRGIKQENFASIFETFFSHYEDHHQASTGIGLALAKSLVELHHGKIEVDSKENEFTSFKVSLRKGKDHFTKEDLAVEINEGEHTEVYPVLSPESSANLTEYINEQHELTHHPRIMLVEDNIEVRNYLRNIFQFDYVISEAGNGKEALSKIEEELPDLIISDIMMPELDGMAFCKEIKTNLRTSHIPVILLTARTSLVYTIEGLEKGADDYITKPFNPKVLQLKVRNLLHAQEVTRKTFMDHQVLQIQPETIASNSMDAEFLKTIFDSIEKNISNSEFSVDVLCKEIGMSRSQLYRKIKAITGQSVNELIRNMRLKHAAVLLKQKRLNISEITYECGFNDLQYFRECFKKFFGVTPSEYVDSGS